MLLVRRRFFFSVCAVIALAVGCSYGEIKPSSEDAGFDASTAKGDAGDAATHDTGVDAGADAAVSGKDAATKDSAVDAADDDDGASPVGIDRVEQIGSGFAHTCVRFESGRIKCWGYNDRGQLGLGDTRNRGGQPSDMGKGLPYVDLGSGRYAKSLSVGRKVNCVLLDDDTVKCWGYNSVGQLGTGTRCIGDCSLQNYDNRGDAPNEMGNHLPAIDFGSGHKPKAISVGGETACVLMDDSSLRCWSSNLYGALGSNAGCAAGDCNTDFRGDAPGEMGAALPAVDLGTGLFAKQISAGWDSVVVLLNDGSIKAWGKNSDGQLGLGDYDNRGDDPGEMGDQLAKVILPASTEATRVFAGAASTCARLDDGTLRCWGSNGAAELGVGDTAPRCATEGNQACIGLTEVTPAAGEQSVAIGVGHACAVRPQGDVRCWGANAYGQLGIGDDQPRGDTPGQLMSQPPSEPLPPERKYVAISAGQFFTCALVDDGRVRCWGQNVFGELGLGDFHDRGLDAPGKDGPIDVDLGQ